MSKLDELLDEFQPVCLSEMDEVKLMNRVETKFVFAVSQLPEILQALSDHYRVLEIDTVKRSRYNTLYFDTEELKFYVQHHNGRLNRKKVRIRKYVDTNQSYVEVKTKNNKGRTNKRRIKEVELSPELTEKASKFISEYANEDSKNLSAQLWNSYNRITLVDIKSKERVTIDLDLEFDENGRKAHVREIVIAEVKQAKYNVRSPFIQQMRSFHIKPMRLSKYCLGTVLLRTDIMNMNADSGVKYNRFKQKVLTIEKIKNGSS